LGIAPPGETPVKRKAALRVARPILEQPVADRQNWALCRLRADIEACVRCVTTPRLVDRPPCRPVAVAAEKL